MADVKLICLFLACKYKNLLFIHVTVWDILLKNKGKRVINCDLADLYTFLWKILQFFSSKVTFFLTKYKFRALKSKNCDFDHFSSKYDVFF